MANRTMPSTESPIAIQPRITPAVARPPLFASPCATAFLALLPTITAGIPVNSAQHSTYDRMPSTSDHTARLFFG